MVFEKNTLLSIFFFLPTAVLFLSQKKATFVQSEEPLANGSEKCTARTQTHGRRVNFRAGGRTAILIGR